ncbi:ribosome rescue protein RqcH [Archaeoglobus neptunius]|uniref:ribosome rescue protein RqcH n=1 Tax=Archaeoglobus neptunius TaxID=2798580 RepID=UPI001925338B
MKQLSSFDIKACVNELRELVGGKVEKVYHHPPSEIRIRIYAGRKVDLVIEAGRRIHLTKFPKQAPRFPSAFAMLLRKHLEGARIVSIEQYDFDRVVIIEFERVDVRKKLVAEIFSKGNIILLDADNRVIMPLKHTVKVGEPYRFPQPIERRDENREVVKFLATSGLGGLYAEEVCLRAGIDKRRKYSELSVDEREKIKREVEALMNFTPKPQIILKNGDYMDVVPMELLYYSQYDKKYFETFNDALDDYYSKKLTEIDELESAKSEKLEKLKKRLEIQKESLRKFESDAETFKRIGDLIYENYRIVDRIIEAFRSARQKKSWKEITEIVRRDERLKRLVVDIKPEKSSITIKLDGFNVELDIRNSIHENADVYYEKSKKAREKADGVKKAIEKTIREMERIDEELERRYISSIKVRRKREWFENYRWFITSEGFLAIGGRSADMNEEIVSKYLETGDLFFHTQTPGAPVVILKRGQDAGETSIREAAEFAATYSALWKEGKHAGEVYYVLPDQVSKSAKSGEYLPKGSFYITGKRNYLTVELNCGIGIEIEKLRVIGGPVSSVRKYANYYVELEIGEMDANRLGVEIAKRLSDMAGDERHIVRAIATPDEIMKFIPPGKSRIRE